MEKDSMTPPRRPIDVDIPHFLQEPMERRVTLTEKEITKLNSNSFERGFNYGFGIGTVIGLLSAAIIGAVVIYLHLSHI